MLIAWAGLRAAKRIAAGTLLSVDIVILVHCAWSLTPFVFDVLVGPPTYRTFVLMREVTLDNAVEVIYLAYIAAVPWILVKLGRARGRGEQLCADERRRQLKSELQKWQPMLLFALVFPILYFLLFAPNYFTFLRYGAVAGDAFTSQETDFFNWLYFATYFAVLAAAGLILVIRRLWISLLLTCPFLFVACWFNGKRNIIFLVAGLLLLALRGRGAMSGKAFATAFGAAVLIYAGFSQWYQAVYRPILIDEERRYEMIRMDYSREADIKMAIFSELNPDLPILEYRGQTLLFAATLPVPRVLWPAKPRPYYHYITSRALKIPYTKLTWGITTTWLSESIANLGWSGMLIGPLFLALVCRIGDRHKSYTVSLLTGIVGSLFLSIQIAGFYPILALWLIIVAAQRPRRSRRPVPRVRLTATLARASV